MSFRIRMIDRTTRSVGVNRNVGLVFYVWLEVGAYHASTEMLPMYLMVLSIRTKYVLNFYVLINIFTGISLRISKLPRIISRARILISHSWAWDIQTRCRLQLSQISLMIWFHLLSPALRNSRQSQSYVL